MTGAGASAQANARARDKALSAATPVRVALGYVDYRCGGHLLVLGPVSEVEAALERLVQTPLHCTALVTDSGQVPGTMTEHRGVQVVHGWPGRVSGYLGHFRVSSPQDLLARALKLALPPDTDTFDMVLDLGATPAIASQVPPPGYCFAPPGDSRALEAAAAHLPTLIGEFEKPRYFRYDADICAHGRSGVSGCTRCIESCPTDAIVSSGDVIEVNPKLCQGAGACATACPSGAITYGYPPAVDTLACWRGLLKAYRAAGGSHPVLLVHDAQHGREALDALADALAGHLLPVEVEELGSIGMEAWLSALAWGAAGVTLLAARQLPASVASELSFQLSVARALLTDLGFAPDCLRLSDGEDVNALNTPPPAPDVAPATFAALDEKRTMIRLAVDHLAQACGEARSACALPEAAPFGSIRVDAGRCTLCMACVSQCPANALAAGEETPQLRFVEAKCVQCGVCMTSCPEQAISLEPRFLYDNTVRNRLRVLHEDVPFHCIRCGRAFATEGVIARITERMKDHPMFGGDALSRLKMCEDCRVKALYQAERGAPDDTDQGENNA